MAAIDVNVAAAEQDVDGLADAIQEAVRCGLDGSDAVQFFADELRACLPHNALEVAVALLLRAACTFCAWPAEMKAGGAELLGHR